MEGRLLKQALKDSCSALDKPLSLYPGDQSSISRSFGQMDETSQS